MTWSREEHLQWAKERAYAYLDVGDWRQALASFMSDLGKHPETATAARQDGLELAMGADNPEERVREWIRLFR
jgi:hypothetical protein